MSGLASLAVSTDRFDSYRRRILAQATGDNVPRLYGLLGILRSFVPSPGRVEPQKPRQMQPAGSSSCARRSLRP